MNVLVISAHMDDEVLGMGGTIAKHLEAGDTVTVCIVCKRAYEHKFDDALVKEEQESTRCAANIIGYEDVRFLSLRDELLDERLLDVIVPLEECVLDVRPSIVYTHHRGFFLMKFCLLLMLPLHSLSMLSNRTSMFRSMTSWSGRLKLCGHTQGSCASSRTHVLCGALKC